MKFKYKGSRQQRLKSQGRQIFCNPAEDAVAVFLRDNEISCSKRGYPDLTVYKSDGSIYGFIEVKPDDDRDLKKEQQVFADFCSSHDIPFIRWCPEDGEEALKEFINDQNSD